MSETVCDGIVKLIKLGNDRILLTFEDKNAKLGFMKVSFSYKDFTAMLTGNSSECEITTVQLEDVGKQYEAKTEHIKIPLRQAVGLRHDHHACIADIEDVKEAIRKYEVDGWKGWIQDITKCLDYQNSDSNHDCIIVNFYRRI